MAVRLARAGDVLQQVRRTTPVSPTETYPMIGARNFARGSFDAGSLRGTDTKYRELQLVKAGDLIYPKLGAWEGAFSFVGPDLGDRYTSPEYCVFTICSTEADAAYLRHLFAWEPFWRSLAARSTGTNVRRRRLQPGAFLDGRLPLPDLPEQQRIAARLDRIRIRQSKLTHPARIRASAIFDAALSRMLDQADTYWTVGEEIQVKGGGTPSKTNPDNWSGGIPWVTPTDLGRLRSRRISETERTLSASGLGGGARLIPPNSVIMSSRAPIGHLAINHVSAATSQGCKSFVPQIQTDPEYLYFAVLSVMGEIKRRGAGTTFSEVSASKLLGLQLPAAEVHAQHEMAAHLARVQDATWRIADLQTRCSSISSALLPAARNEEFTRLT
jgi:restriction endonuclease S subunit